MTSKQLRWNYYAESLPEINWIYFSGVSSFAVAHVMYILAFGFKPLRPLIYAGFSLIGVIIYSLLYAGLTDTVLKIGVLCYIVLIVGMNWRALARIR